MDTSSYAPPAGRAQFFPREGTAQGVSLRAARPRHKPGGPRSCGHPEPPGPEKLARTWTPTPRVTTAKCGLPKKTSKVREAVRNHHTTTQNAPTQAKASNHRDRTSREEREREREECTLSIFTRLARAWRVCVRAGVTTPRWWCVWSRGRPSRP